MKITAKHCTGFTFVEMVVVILVMAIMAIGLTQFISYSSEGYVDTASRNQLTTTGRAVVEKISQELHNALPNSVRITDVFMTGDSEGLNDGDQCLEFIPILAATTYIDPPFHPDSGTNTFTVVAFNLDDINAISNDYAVIYPRKESEIYDSTFPSPGYIAKVTDLDVGTVTGTHRVNLTSSHAFKKRSPLDRVYLVDDPVSFCVHGDSLYRYTNYGVRDDQSIPDSGSCPTDPNPMCLPTTTPDRVLLAKNLSNGLANTAFNQLAATLKRNAIVQIELNFEDENNESVLIHHEVMLQNAP